MKWQHFKLRQIMAGLVIIFALMSALMTIKEMPSIYKATKDYEILCVQGDCDLNETPAKITDVEENLSKSSGSNYSITVEAGDEKERISLKQKEWEKVSDAKGEDVELGKLREATVYINYNQDKLLVKYNPNTYFKTSIFMTILTLTFAFYLAAISKLIQINNKVIGIYLAIATITLIASIWTAIDQGGLQVYSYTLIFSLFLAAGAGHIIYLSDTDDSSK